MWNDRYGAAGWFVGRVVFDPITIGALALTAAGTAVTAAGTLVGGARAEESAEFRAQQIEGAAAESRAAAQRQAFERRRAAKLTLSSLQARSAAFAGDASDPGIVRLAGDIAARGEYQALAEMYTGENRARGLTDEAMGTRMSGAAARQGSYFAAGGQVLSGLGGMFKTYGSMSSPGSRAPTYG